MALKKDDTLITKGDLKKFYNKILPYMGGNYVFNTLGTKDYYSEDEKVIGVWTDGKPLYRKTVTGNITAKNQSLFTVNENVDVMVSLRGYTNTGVYYFPFNFTQSGSTQRCVFYKKDTDSIELRSNEFISGETFTVILEYTKTTDAVNSAVDTIGCYDITRPDLWPVGKEITFGNGLYGQRFTGTYSLSAKQWKSINLSTLIPLSIVDYGGTIQQSTWFNTLPLCYIGNDGALQSEATIWYDPSNNTGLTMSIYFSTSQTNSKYDVWVTYKKK